MSFNSIIQGLLSPGETYTLQRRGIGTTPIRNEVGSLNKDWIDVQVLSGIIQSPSHMRESPRGGEELANYTGFFEPDFEIPDNHLSNYRIKRVVPDTTPLTYFYRIKEINRNLTMKNVRHHYELILEINPKWF